jgi:hypothetical protein
MTPPSFSWLDDFFGPAIVKIGSLFLPKRPVLEFVATGGAGVMAEDDPINKKITVTVDSAELVPAGVNGDIQLKNGSGALSALHGANVDDVAAWNGTTWVSQTRGTGRWQIAYEVDFTSLTLATASGNGNFTIDGKTWTVGNFAHSSVMSAGGADGLRIKCNSTITSTAVATNSEAYFMLPLSQVLGAIPDDCRFGLRVSFLTKAFTRAASQDATTFQVCTSDFDSQRAEAQQYNSSGTQTDWQRLVLKTSTKTSGDIAPTLTSPATHDCIEIEIPRLGEDSTLIHTGISSGGQFPTKWYPRAFPQSAAGQWIDIQLDEIAKGFIAIGQVAATGAATSEIKIGRMRVEYYLYQ